jgi:hypothetical protein
MVEELVREFIPRRLVADLDFSGLQRVTLSPDSTLWPWQPHGRYYLLEISAFAEDELARRSGLVALLFRLERRHSPEGLRVLLDEVIDWFRRHEGYGRLRGLFFELIRDAFARHRMSLSAFGNLLEVRSMLTIDFEPWKKKWRAEGKAEGKADALISLLAGRFGAVAPSRQKRIRGARLATINRWFKRAIVAPDLPSVFTPPR